MVEKVALSWEQFKYLNGFRKINQHTMLRYEEHLQNMQSIKLASVNGRIEKKMKKLAVEMAELNTLLMGMVEKERVKDFSLYLEDLD